MPNLSDCFRPRVIWPGAGTKRPVSLAVNSRWGTSRRTGRVAFREIAYGPSRAARRPAPILSSPPRLRSVIGPGGVDRSKSAFKVLAVGWTDLRRTRPWCGGAKAIKKPTGQRRNRYGGRGRPAPRGRDEIGQGAKITTWHRGSLSGTPGRIVGWPSAKGGTLRKENR